MAGDGSNAQDVKFLNIPDEGYSLIYTFDNCVFIPVWMSVLVMPRIYE
jgi:hypothetical protein